MMHRLRRYDGFHLVQNDVAPDGRNDAMLANVPSGTHHSQSKHHWRQPTSFAKGKHHSKKLPLSVGQK